LLAFPTLSFGLDKIKYRLYHKIILNDSEFRGNRPVKACFT